MREVYVSTDVETDGPIPGENSMLSLGCAAYLDDKSLIGTFSVNLEPLPGAKQHPRTMEWWSAHPEAWEACRTESIPAELGMERFVEWIEELPGQPVFVAYPASFDFMFVYWYLMRFVGRSPFGHSALDIRSYTMAALRTRWQCSRKQYMPRRWFSERVHSHRSLDDAIEQGALFCNMLSEQLQDRDRTPASALLSPEDEYERLLHFDDLPCP
jgi:hypothetical protein